MRNYIFSRSAVAASLVALSAVVCSSQIAEADSPTPSVPPVVGHIGYDRGILSQPYTSMDNCLAGTNILHIEFGSRFGSNGICVDSFKPIRSRNFHWDNKSKAYQWDLAL
jgi:hypothetical protein